MSLWLFSLQGSQNQRCVCVCVWGRGGVGWGGLWGVCVCVCVFERQQSDRTEFNIDLFYTDYETSIIIILTFMSSCNARTPKHKYKFKHKYRHTHTHAHTIIKIILWQKAFPEFRTVNQHSTLHPRPQVLAQKVKRWYATDCVQTGKAAMGVQQVFFLVSLTPIHYPRFQMKLKNKREEKRFFKKRKKKKKEKRGGEVGREGKKGKRKRDRQRQRERER